jgi:endonuclease YncB( thermonuclease family)
MSHFRPGGFLAMAVVAGWAGLAGAAEVTVLDGDTLRYDGRTVRLWGIDAPQKPETCKTSGGTDWPCGERAFQQLSEVSADDAFSCESRQADFVVCMTGGLDVGLLMVREGLAHARQGYADAEAMARAAKVGIWE